MMCNELEKFQKASQIKNAHRGERFILVRVKTD